MTRAADLAKLLAGGGKMTGDLVIESAGGINSACLQIDNTLTSGSFPKAIEAYQANIPVGARNQIMLGKDGSPYDTATLQFYYAGNASTSNRFEIGFWNADSLLNVLADGKVGIGTTSPDDELDIEGADPAIRLTDTSASGYARVFANNGSLLLQADEGNSVSNSIVSFDVDGSEAMRIDSGGEVHIGSTAAATGSTRVSMHQSSNQDVLQLENTNASFSDRVIISNAHRAASSAYQFLLNYSGDFADLEHNLRGDGNAYADGSWNGGGADYAEYFEWKDGNTSDEDRVGISVKLDGDKIVASSDSDNASDIIGVISANPSITGDSAWNKWNQKYLTDDYGRYKLDGNGERTLNPSYDKDKTYIAREDRKEWDVVGLMGKLRIKKGQKTGTNWIKMRDVSDTVEEWLVR